MIKNVFQCDWDYTLVAYDREKKKKKTIGEKEEWLKLRIDLKSVWEPFSDAQPRVVRWRDVLEHII